MNRVGREIYIFAGNRFYVLSQMLALGIQVDRIFAVKGSWLEKELQENCISYELLPEKGEFVEVLKVSNFDFFISNGLPHILPVSEITRGTEKKLINIHPSYLPDLRGADPQPGALLFGRDSGATCHYMNDQIDAGAIIAQEKIACTEDMDAGLLYQLSFMAEQVVFQRAYERKFVAQQHQSLIKDAIYYSFKKRDLIIDFNQPTGQVIRKIKAFNTPNKLARFVHNGQEWPVCDAAVIDNAFMDKAFDYHALNQVVIVFQDKLVIKRESGFLICTYVSSSGLNINDLKGEILDVTSKELHSEEALSIV